MGVKTLGKQIINLMNAFRQEEIRGQAHFRFKGQVLKLKITL
jgi:hypothetical protein